MATAGKPLLNFRHSWGQADSWAVIYERSQTPGTLEVPEGVQNVDQL